MYVRHPDRARDFPLTASLVGLTLLINAAGLAVSLDDLVAGPSWTSEPWCLVTSIFPHGDPLHLGMNILWVWILGVMVEVRFGTLRTAGLGLLFAVASSAGQLCTGTPGIGLSGVVYGYAGLLAVMSRRDRRLADALPRPVETGFLLWILVGMLLTRAQIYPVGNAAHITGGLVGLLAGLALAKPHYRIQAERERWVAQLGAGLTAAATLALIVVAGRMPSSTYPAAELVDVDTEGPVEIHMTFSPSTELIPAEPRAAETPRESLPPPTDGGQEEKRRFLERMRDRSEPIDALPSDP